MNPLRASIAFLVATLVLLGLAVMNWQRQDDAPATRSATGVVVTDAPATTPAPPAAPTSPQTTATPTTAAPTTAAPTPTLPNGAPLFDGYPKLVSASEADHRIANWNEGIDQFVVLAPGVYAAYNPNVPDLLSYLDGPTDGDCAMRDEYFPNSGGACWSGVR